MSLLLTGLSSLACSGEVDGSGSGAGNRNVESSSPPPVNTRFTLRIDGKSIELEPPSGTRFVDSRGTVSTTVSITAQEDPGGGDSVRAASVTLSEPFSTGAFDCTPNERGEWVGKRATLSPGPFFGFTPRVTDCLVTVQYIANDRVVGTFSANAHAPEQSSLSGTIARVAGEFDVPVRETKL